MSRRSFDIFEQEWPWLTEEEAEGKIATGQHFALNFCTCMKQQRSWATANGIIAMSTAIKWKQ